MAQIIPSITSLPVDSSAAPSVEDIQDRLPSICVDYLSHDWSEEDVWASWRNMTRHKHEIANGVRLENASWRTWQKQRNKLKTISPETLNWLKDSDVTWLYGPLHTASVEPVRPPRESTTVERLGIDGVGIDRPVVSGPVKKPILKHRTLSEMLTIPMPASPVLESYGGGDDDIENIDEHRPGLIQTKSDTNIIRSRGGMKNRRKSPSRAPISGRNTPGDGQQTPVNPTEEPLQTGGSSKRHISFNTFVEQCMAIDDPSDVPMIDSDDDDMLEMRSSSSRSSRPSLPRTASTGSVTSEHLTIAKIAPTMLKTQAFSNSEKLPQMIYQPPPEYLSPVAQFSPSPRGGWADQDDGGSHDYFGGPNLQQDDSSYKVQSVPVHQAYRAPTVSQPPIQPKWRQGQVQSGSPAGTGHGTPSSLDSSTSSSTASLNNASPQSSTPVPARSILKVRAPGPTPPEPASPPSNYFNYTPSAATGIGGMRGQYIESATPSPVSGVGSAQSPLVSPAFDDRGGRGRTTSRDRGNSAFDRSSSRGTTGSSSSTGTSISPGASRSPVGAQRKPQPPIQGRVLDLQQDEDKFVENVDAKAGGMDIDDDDESPQRGSTPTPHSSPQIPLRRLHDTSPASLPHYPTSHPSVDPSPSPLPMTDPPNSLSPPNSIGVRATTASVSTQAKPTIQNNRSGGDAARAAEVASAPGPSGTRTTGGSAFGRLQGHGQQYQRRAFSGGDQAYGDNEDDDGSSIMGRAANIANTAKDLLGALWYGANQQPVVGDGQAAQAGGGDAGATKSKRRHQRGASMG